MLFEEDTPITLKQENFLSNENNKSRFISFLKAHLQKRNVSVTISPDDADPVIVGEAIDLSHVSKRNVVIVGEDIDLLILIIELTPSDMTSLLLKLSKETVP